MAKGNGNKTDILENYKRFDLTEQKNYEADYPSGDFSNPAEKILAMPDVDNMVGAFIRSVMTNKREKNAALRLFYRNKKFKDDAHQELLLCSLAASVAMGGRGRVDAVFSQTNLIAPDMYRAVIGLPKNKKNEREEVVRGGRNSDFRKEEGPPNGGLGGQD